MWCPPPVVLHHGENPSAMTSSLPASCTFLPPNPDLHHDIGCHPGAGLAANSCCALQRKAHALREPGASSSCTVMAINIDGAATPAEAPCEGKGRSRRRKDKKTRETAGNQCGPGGPSEQWTEQCLHHSCFEISRAFSPSIKLENNTEPRNSCSTRETSCCHPPLMRP